MIFDTDEVPLSHEETEAVKRNATERLVLCRRRALYSLGALFLSCASVYPFVDGRVLSAHGEFARRVLLLVSLVSVIVSLYCVLLWWAAWRILRDPGNG
jgi:hypothetical protein